jgi:hypothetical protein
MYCAFESPSRSTCISNCVRRTGRAGSGLPQFGFPRLTIDPHFRTINRAWRCQGNALADSLNPAGCYASPKCSRRASQKERLLADALDCGERGCCGALAASYRNCVPLDPARSGRWGKATPYRTGAERAPIVVNFSYSVSGRFRLFAIRNDLLSGTGATISSAKMTRRVSLTYPAWLQIAKQSVRAAFPRSAPSLEAGSFVRG